MELRTLVGGQLLSCHSFYKGLVPLTIYVAIQGWKKSWRTIVSMESPVFVLETRPAEIDYRLENEVDCDLPPSAGDIDLVSYVYTGL